MVIGEKTRNIIFFCIIIIVIFTISVVATKDFDLSDYPKPFVQENVLASIIIVGENAKIGDMIGAIDIATGLGPPFESGIIKLDTEIENIKGQDVIIVGGPCVNTVAAELMGVGYKVEPECYQDFEEGKAKIKLFEDENVALLVAGSSADDTRRACTVLKNYKDYADALVGAEVEMTATSDADIVLAAPAVEEPAE